MFVGRVGYAMGVASAALGGGAAYPKDTLSGVAPQLSSQ